jgi:hypothetical protein
MGGNVPRKLVLPVKDCPCYKDGKDCAKRVVGCHAKCKEYTDWRADRTEKSKAIYKKNYGAHLAEDWEVRAKIKNIKRRKGKA